MQLRYHGSEQKFPLLSLDAHYYVSEAHNLQLDGKELIYAQVNDFET